MCAQVMAAAHRHDRAGQRGVGASAAGACPFASALTALDFTICTPSVQAFFPELKVPEDFRWKLFLSADSMHRTLIELPLTEYSTQNSSLVSEETLNQVLADMRLAGKLAVCDLNVPFKFMFSLRPGTWMKFFAFVYNVCSHRGPDNIHDAGCNAVYHWWRQTVQELRQTTQVTLVDAPPARKEAACASFDSFVKMMCKALAYLERVLPRFWAPLAQVASPEQAALRQAFGV